MKDNIKKKGMKGNKWNKVYPYTIPGPYPANTQIKNTRTPLVKQRTSYSTPNADRIQFLEERSGAPGNRTPLNNVGAKSTKGYKWEVIYKKKFISKSLAMSFKYHLKNNRKLRQELLSKYESTN